MPKRIRLQRTLGWKMPPNTVSVARPSKWGNPFPVKDRDNEHAVDLFRDFIATNPDFGSKIKLELEGKNLACYCRLDQACHADVLLEIANKA